MKRKKRNSLEARKKLLVLFAFLVLTVFVLATPQIDFVDPTFSNNTYTTNTAVEINVSITEPDLDKVIYNWNGTNYTMYDDSLVLMMNFDNVSGLGENDTHVFDISGNGNNGTVSGSGDEIVLDGKYGSAIDVLTSEQITISHNSDLVPPVHASFWFKKRYNDSTGNFFMKYGGAAHVWDGWSIGLNGNNQTQIWVNGNTHDTYWNSGSNTVVDTEWHHVYADINVGGSIKLYLDGLLVIDSTDSNSAYSETVDLLIGNALNGTIDELRMWDRTLTEAEIYQQYVSNLNKFNSTQWYLYVNQSKNATDVLDYGTYTYQTFVSDSSNNWNNTEQRTVVVSTDATFPVLNFTSPTLDNGTSQSDTNVEVNVSINELNLDEIKYNWNSTNYTIYNDSLILMFNFDNVSDLNENDTYVVDVSKYGNNGTGFEGATYNSSGKYNGAFEFDGADDYITGDFPFNLTEFSFSAWIYEKDPNDNGAIFQLWNNTNQRIQLQRFNSSAMLLYSDIGPANWGRFNFHNITANEWTHVALTNEQDTWTLYLNGENKSTITAPGVENLTDPLDYYIGARKTTTMSIRFNGTIDEVRMWDRCLSVDEIYQDYVTNLNKVNSSQWHLYVNQSKNATTGLDEGTYSYYTIATDLSSNSNQTETRTVTIDSTAPNVTLNLPDEDYYNDSSDPVNITFNCSVTDNLGLSNISLYLTNLSNQSFSLNQTTNVTGTSNNANWTLNLANGNYTWNCLVYDSAGNSDWSSNRTVAINYTEPPVVITPNCTVNFSVQTPMSGDVRIMQNFVPINTSFTGENVTVYLYNSSKNLINSSTGTSSPFFVNYTNLTGGVYYFNATAFNSTGSNSTLTRNVLVSPNAGGNNTKSHVKISDGLAGFSPEDLGLSDYFGRSVANIGDLNGDGVQDLAVGAEGDEESDSNEGAVFILFMNTSGGVSSHVKISDGREGFDPGGLGRSDGFGSSITNLGDLDGDDVQDLAVGAYWDESDSLLDETGESGEGAVYILFMNSSGGVKSNVKISDDLSGFSPSGLDRYDMFGWSVANIGDLDGDGVQDIAVGALGDEYKTDDSEDEENAEGAIYIMFLNVSGGVKDHVKISDGESGFYPSGLGSRDYFGSSIANIGDLDLDGIQDLAVGAIGDENNQSSQGAIYILFMNRSGEVNSNVKISNGLNGLSDNSLDMSDNFGNGVTNAGDLNNDGVQDLVVGARQDMYLSPFEGAIYILYMNRSGGVVNNIKITDGLAGFNPDGLGNWDGFGISVANIGDLDRDGVQDLAVGAYIDENNESGEGALYILNLREGTDVLAPDINFSGLTTASGNYSESSITVAVTANDEYLDTVTTYLYNSTGLVNTTIDSDSITVTYTNLPEGTYYVNATANDTASNNASTVTRTIVLDTTPPGVVVLAPVDSFNSSVSNQNFSINATDATGISCTLFMDKLGYVGNQSINTNTSVTSGASTTLNASSLNNRTHTWYVNCSDAAGNSNTSSTRTITIDQVAPSVTITTPRLNDILGYNIYVYTDISDSLTDIDTANYYILNVSNSSHILANGSLNSTSNWDAVWNSSSYADAEWNVTFKVTANDTVGNSYSVNNTFLLDNQNPSIQFIAPPIEKMYYNSNYSMNVVIQDLTLNYTNYSILTTSLYNSTSYPSNTTSHSWRDLINSSDLVDGTYNLTMFAQDAASNNRTLSTLFVMDTTSPSVTLNYPSTSLRTNATQISFNWTVTDNIALTMLCNLSINNVVVKPNVLCTNNTDCLETINGFTWADYVWNVSCLDNASNINDPSGRGFIPDWRDLDSDSSHDDVDNLIGVESNITQNGTTSLDITVGGSSNLTTFNDSKEVLFYDNSNLIINFTHNFTARILDLRNITIKRNSSYILVNHSGQLSGNKTLYLTDDDFTELCVKDSEINNISEMTDTCVGEAEYDFVECIGNSTGVTIDGITCIDLGSRFVVKNLQYSAIRGTQSSSSSESSSQQSARNRICGDGVCDVSEQDNCPVDCGEVIVSNGSDDIIIEEPEVEQSENEENITKDEQPSNIDEIEEVVERDTVNVEQPQLAVEDPIKQNILYQDIYFICLLGLVILLALKIKFNNKPNKKSKKK